MTSTQPIVVQPPIARRQETVTTLHGHRLADDYAWLREKDSPEVIAFLEQENAYTRAVMKPTEELQARLYAEMISHIKETDVSVPFRDRDYFYYSRTEQGAQYPIYCRKHGSLDATEEVMLDMNQMAAGEGSWRWAPSPSPTTAICWPIRPTPRVSGNTPCTSRI